MTSNIDALTAAISRRANAGAIQARVTDMLVEREVARRAEMITSALNKLESAQKDHQAIKPDIESFDIDDSGQETRTTQWSKAQLKKFKDSQARIAKIQEAIEKALDGDFSKIGNLK